MIALIVSVALATGPTEAEPPNRTMVNVLVLTGQPDTEATHGPAVEIFPGTVLYAGGASDEKAADRAHEHARLISALEESYRIKADQRMRSTRRQFQVGDTELIGPVNNDGPMIEVTLLGLGPSLPSTREGTRVGAEPVATYRVRIRHRDKVLAEPVVAVQPRGRAIVGTRDGEAAPYLFIVLESATGTDSGMASAHDGVMRYTAPKKIYNVDPEYPADAKAAKVQGLVMLRCRIDVEGRVQDLEVVRGVAGELGAKLNEAAMEAVRQWRYEPTLDETGKPKEAKMTLSINFKLAASEPR